MLGNCDCLFFLPDQHAITMPHMPERLRSDTLDCVAQYVACGLNPLHCKIFLQSQVIGHTELMWVLSCLTPIGQLERMTQFKDKSKKVGGAVTSGLLFYPVLMAADILLYNAALVPVGEDQRQHLELTRDVAQKFNAAFGETFAVPEAYIGKVGARIMSLQNPAAKMSKSDSNQNAVVYLTDSDAVISKKIMAAVTDSGSGVIFDPINKPGIANLLNIYAAATDIEVNDAVSQFANVSGYASFKRAVADAVIGKVAPIREIYFTISSNGEYLRSVLCEGRVEAQRRADAMIAEVYRRVGFLES
jgi:tryptophanyl-tRNA synthetase